LSVQAISWVIEQSKHKGNSFVVLLMIANHAKSDGTGAWPSIKTLSKESRISERTVQRCIHRLSRKWSGVKNWQKEPPELKILVGKGPHGCNLYDIPGVKLSPLRGCQTGTEGVSDSVTGGVSQVSPEPSFNRPLKQPSNTAQPQRVHSPEQIRQIEAKQKRLEREDEVARELYVGAGPVIVPGLMDELRRIGEAKKL
jgi:hypothetical protein